MESSDDIRRLFADHSLRDRSPARRAGIGRVLATLTGAPTMPPRLGPFALGDELGRGGMGVVYAAVDTRLRRRVAIKVLRDDLALRDREAILREARSLARLSHPHVVEVFATGVDDGYAWVAMELVDGGTLGDWAAAHPVGSPGRTRTALAMLLDVGEGLAAAHARGIVHRDIKPGNVLVGGDGRVRLGDFGLARFPSDDDGTDPSQPSAASGGKVGPSTRTPVDTNAIAGTPRYMAPEQLARRRCTERSDQYAFALMAWEVLVGRFPFPGRTLAELRDAKAGGRPSPPRTKAVPTRALRVLARGLDPDPERRFASMSDLLAALRGPGRRRGLRPAIVGIGVVAIAVGLAQRPASAGSRCDTADAETRLHAVWDASRRARVQAAFAEVDYGARSFATVDAAIERFGPAWVDESVATCRATRDGDTAAAPDLDARAACLRAQLQLVDRLLARVERSETGSIERASAAFSQLPDPTACEAGDGVAPTVRSEDLARRLAAVQAAYLLGDLAQADEQARAVEERARIEGDAIARCEALEHIATIAFDRRESAEALRAASEGYAIATGAEAPQHAARLAHIAAVAAADGHARDEAAQWLRHYDATLARFEPTPIERATAARAAAHVAREASDFEGAEAHCARAMALVEGIDTPAARLDHLASVSLMATIVADLGRADEAEQLGLEAVAQYEAIYGPQHPRVAGRYHELAIEAYRKGQMAVAGERFQRAYDIFVTAHGPTAERTIAAATGVSITAQNLGDLDRAAAILESIYPQARTTQTVSSAQVLTNLAAIREDQGEHEAALELLHESQALQDRFMDADDPLRGDTVSVLATVLRKLGRYEEAAQQLRQLQVLYVAAGDRRMVANATVQLGVVTELQGDREAALRAYDDALEQFLMLNAAGPDVAFAAGGVGRMRVALGDPAGALGPLRQALAWYEASDRQDAIVSAARIRGALGLALLATGERTEGLALVRAAYPVLEEDGGVDSADLRARLREAIGQPLGLTTTTGP